MRILIYMGHPAHFHLFKNAIRRLQARGAVVKIVIKKKDVLEDLLRGEGFEFENILTERRKSGLPAIAWSTVQKDLRTFALVRRFKPDLMLGTSSSIAHVGKLTGIPSVVLQEDDWDVIPAFARTVYPFATKILAPQCCRMGRWEDKTIRYDSYHELAYLHPDHFTPDPDVVKTFHTSDRPYYLLRFVGLDAFHDDNIAGLSRDRTFQMIELLNKKGDVYITSEKKLDGDLDKYRIRIDPVHIHHALAFADMFIGDSQTMAAEAAVLGTPTLRCNDFVGRISYLEELEKGYQLGFGFKPTEFEDMFNQIQQLLAVKDVKKTFAARREIMLREKANLADLLVTFIENYPQSVAALATRPGYQS